MSVARAQQEISSREFAEWLAFSTIEGEGGRGQQTVEQMQDRLRMHFAMVGARGRR